MPTFSDPNADAAEASEAVRGLAHALRAVDHPRDVYNVLGELALLNSRLTAVTAQLAGSIERHQRLALDDYGDRAAGTVAARAVAQELTESSRRFVATGTSLDRAFQLAAQIAWEDAPSPALGSRYIGVVFLEGEAADRILDMIPLYGTDHAIGELVAHDAGADTVEAALENGYVYDEPPLGSLDLTATRDEYTLVYNPFMGNLGLYRAHDALPDPALLDIKEPLPQSIDIPSVRPVRHSVDSDAAAGQEQIAEQGRSRRERLGTPTVNRQRTPASPFASTLGL